MVEETKYTASTPLDGTLDGDLTHDIGPCFTKCNSIFNSLLFLKPSTRCFEQYKYPLIKPLLWENQHWIWYMSIPPSQSKPDYIRDDVDTLLFFHPITTNIVHTYHMLIELCKQPPMCYFQVICVEYPGYASDCDTTTSNEHSFLTQYPLYVLKVMEHEQKTMNKAFAVGYSMGTTMATFFAAHCPLIRGLILMAPFSSINDVIRDSYNGLQGMFGERFPSKKWITKVKCPIFIIHGTRDKTCPFWHSVDMFWMAHASQAAPYRELTLVENVGHVDLCRGNQCFVFLKHMLDKNYMATGKATDTSIIRWYK